MSKVGGFKWYLLNEQKAYFGRQVGDILAAVQDLEGDMSDMGTRQVVKLGQNIVNQIRRILHSSWPDERKTDLKRLQKIGVALMKSIDEKGDVRIVINSVTRELEDLSGRLGVKINPMSPPKEMGQPVGQEDFEQTGEGPAKPPAPPPGSEPQPPQPGQPGLPPPPTGQPEMMGGGPPAMPPLQ